MVALLVAAVQRRLAADPTAPLRGARADGVLIVLGEELPWADGVAYLGWDCGLLLPTTIEPDLPADLVREAVHGVAGPAATLVVRPGSILAVPVLPTASRPATWAAVAGPAGPPRVVA